MEIDTKHKLIIAGAVVALGVLVVFLKNSSSQSATSGTSTDTNGSSGGQAYLPATVSNNYYGKNSGSTINVGVTPTPNPAQSTTVSASAPSHSVGTSTGTSVPATNVSGYIGPAQSGTGKPPNSGSIPVQTTSTTTVSSTSSHVTQTPSVQLSPQVTSPTQAQVVSEQSQSGGSINSAYVNPGISNPAQIALALGTQGAAQSVSSANSHVNQTQSAHTAPAPVVVIKIAQGAAPGVTPNPVQRRVAAF